MGRKGGSYKFAKRQKELKKQKKKQAKLERQQRKAAGLAEAENAEGETPTEGEAPVVVPVPSTDSD